MSAGRPLGPELALLGLLALLWGSSYLFIKVAVAEIPPLTVIAARVGIAALFLLAVVRWQDARLPREGATWGRLTIQAFCNSIGAWTLLAWGQQFIDAGLASVLNSTAPIFVFLLALGVTRHEPVGLLRMAGACVGLCGVVLIVGLDALEGLGQQVAGQLAAIASALLYACAAIHGRRFAHLPPAVTAAGTMMLASAVLVPLSLAIDRPWTLAPSAEAVIALAALGLASTGAALMIYFRLVQTLGPLGTASQAYLRAGVGVLLGVVILGEQITPAVAIGLAAAILGVAAINLAPRKC